MLNFKLITFSSLKTVYSLFIIIIIIVIVIVIIIIIITKESPLPASSES